MTATRAKHFNVGDRVRHYGQQYDSALDGTATVVEVVPQGDGTFEYRVDIDAEHRWFGGTGESWWASYHTLAAEVDA